jgi:hypothetical protein
LKLREVRSPEFRERFTEILTSSPFKPINFSGTFAKRTISAKEFFLLIIGDIEKGDLFYEECRNDR